MTFSTFALVANLMLQIPVVLLGATNNTYYVDPVKGNDNDDGRSANHAFRTISAAQVAIRKVNHHMNEDITVYLRSGTYTVPSTIKFSEEDSGTNGYNILYKAFPGEIPVISGGTNLSGGWSLYDKVKNIYSKKGVSGTFRQLYVNGEWCVRARYPNLNDNSTGGTYLKAINNKAPFQIESKEIGSWARNGVCEFVWLAHWTQNRSRISDYTDNDTISTVLFRLPEDKFDRNHHFQSKTYYYFENAYELLDSEGEWFLDDAKNVLYYKPRNGENMSTVEVIAPNVQRLINIEGNISSVHNIQFSGITFKHDNWIDVNNYGYISMQGGQVIQTVEGPVETDTVFHRFSPTSGMICLKNANNIRVERNVFTQGGSWGIMEFENCDHNTYIGNYFTRLASGGIVIGNTSIPRKWYEMPAGQSSYDLISNNLIDDVCCYYMDAVGILAMKVKYVTIKNNEIRNLPYTGISVGFEWVDTGDQDSHDNTVSYNRVHNIMTLLDDGGGIYALGKNTGGSITKNYIYNLQKSKYSGANPNTAYYLDRGSCFWTIEYNVSDFAGMATYVKNTPIHDNIGRYYFYNGPFGKGISGYSLLTNNLDCTNKKWPQEAIEIMNNSGIETPFRNIGSVTFGANIAVDAKVSASSTFDSQTTAANGNDNNCLSGQWSSDKSEKNPFWQIDLGTPYKISEIEIVAGQVDRQDASRLNFEIRASNSADFKTYIQLDSIGNTGVISYRNTYSKIVDNKNSFRYVRIQRINNAGQFSFSECRIFGKSQE